MSYSGFYDEGSPMGMYQNAMLGRRGGAPRRFDEYFRCYPVVMLPGPDREDANHGGKVFLPPSALDKLTRLHITYPMLFELVNGARDRQTHAGVLEFIAEEGKVYLPHWLMETLLLEPGDLIQIKSTDLPLGSFIKLQPQSTDFLEISDPKAVLENAFRNFSCLTTNDVFTFSYNDNIYSVAVLETKPENPKKAISVLETDLSVDFAAPVGYEEKIAAEKAARDAAKAKARPGMATGSSSGTSTPRSGFGGAPLANESGVVHPHGTMAQAINYPSIAPNRTGQAPGTSTSSHFQSEGRRITTRKPGAAESSAASSSTALPIAPPASSAAASRTHENGPLPLRLPEGKLFFGYGIVPVKQSADGAEGAGDDDKKGRFQGAGMNLRKKKGGK
ncbi:UFD1-domain-containing protein [Eremomyces bilateralis CBS 781.70]|uniref:Ubiquitin fusion degradation protein 1 n=1 Tax=Eremomyces bilateralis CBS 781.70 TaxID=1392243 RepID=A0A6G1G560_9PEZI|nr:UFD1-domain-containing protein [Eremomyces bilateralis CBS 781.70]KAF1813158.1 UFD1-domain-containing protein [Eremomyces bilateralis CBS 781.70]